jgi:hypothetical protein
LRSGCTQKTKDFVASFDGDQVIRLPVTSGLPPEADIVTAGRHVSKVPILLQKSVETGLEA